ncbi:hypothetical protein C5167_032526 [Papaver somniferum]|uniref:Cytoplasmic tRNA 2-thiolation protein 2 n=1 Tax=Papaver somniferum TaxID=3469 RepID=A0A4Y7KB30_PAPSO|nr:hypothetical protein C5167_032526 [Papaver somniferum]
MACASGGCGGAGGGCYKDEEEKQVLVSEHQNQHHYICLKCKVEEFISSSSGDFISDLCFVCFRSNLFAKITTNDLISPTDKVLVAFSGGHSSRIALQFVHELQEKAQKNSEASRDKAYPVFGVGVAFIDETNINSLELDKAIQDLRLIVSSLSLPEKELHIMPIGNICSSDPVEGRNKMSELLCNVTDATGKEDLLRYLRMLCLQKVYFCFCLSLAECGVMERDEVLVLMRSCTSSIACHIISATVKGQGYSLPADMQYIDARWEIPVVLPLQDCVAQELKMLCCLDSLKTLEVLDGPRAGINGLVSSFIQVLLEENPGRERTIVRTAEKLSPFHFNRLPEESKDSNNSHLPSRWRRRKKQNLKSHDESMPSEFLCPVCFSPLTKSEFESLTMKLGSSDTCSESEIFGSSCCPSCQFQILPKEHSSMEQFYTLLPQPMIARAPRESMNGDQTWLREQIKDCLLSDGEDGT